MIEFVTVLLAAVFAVKWIAEGYTHRSRMWRRVREMRAVTRIQPPQPSGEHRAA